MSELLPGHPKGKQADGSGFLIASPVLLEPGTLEVAEPPVDLDHDRLAAPEEVHDTDREIVTVQPDLFVRPGEAMPVQEPTELRLELG